MDWKRHTTIRQEELVEQALTWTSEMSIGIDVIDDQHKRIVHYINALHRARLANDRDVVARVIGELVDYTLSHFGFEEALMEQAGYAFLPVHKKVHQIFRKRVGEFQLRFAGGEDVALHLQNTLAKWLVEHIQREDRDYIAPVSALLALDKKTSPEDPKSGWVDKAIHRYFGSH